MGILAHTLWTGAGAMLLRRRMPIAPRAVALALSLAALPDLLQLLPIVGWWVAGSGSFEALRGYAVAVPTLRSTSPSIPTGRPETRLSPLDERTRS